MKPIIFLDVDGVLNCAADFDRFESLTSAGTILDPEKVARVNELKRMFDADIVLSSSWRMYPDGLEALTLAGIAWIDTTAMRMSADRCYEILDYIREHNVKVFVILDDDSTVQREEALRNRHVWTDFTVGFQEKHFYQAVHILLRQTTYYA